MSAKSKGGRVRNPLSIREEKPNTNPNASFYDIRLHFQGSTTDMKGKTRMKSDSSDVRYTELLASLRAAMKQLARRIEPKFYEYGFWKR